jgi:hypothetical protein
MPAGLKFQSTVITSLCIFSVILLSACSRDNPLSIPPEFVEEPEALCLENGPYLDLTLLESIDITNTAEPVPENYPYAFKNTLITFTTPFLTNRSDIIPRTITETSYEYDEESETYETFLVVTQKSLNLDLLDKVSYQELRRIDGYSPLVMSISVSVTYPKEGSQAFDEISDELLFVSSDLDYGVNTITTKVAVSLKVPRTSIDCVNPLTAEELSSDNFKDEDLYKVVQISQSFPVEIDRQNLSTFEQKELTSIISNSENDKFGRIMDVNEQFLVIGSPSEDSDAKGIILSDKFTTNDEQERFVQNEGSADSGAVYIFQKEGVNSWAFHSFIKSSNSDAGDLFGSAVSLHGNNLVISALGEDSITSGIHNSTDSQVNNYKLNNSAQSSGAVYMYEFDNSSNTWSEKYYIKPKDNTITDGDFNKGFGSQLALYKNKLLISAPLEDSDESGSASQPDSGAVYVYSNVLSNGWNYAGALKAINAGAGDQFGSAIAVNDNYFVVGSPFEDHSSRVITDIRNYEEDPEEPFENNSRKDSGAVYVYKHSLQNDAFFATAHIKATNSDAFDYFGTSVALLNNKLLVGSIGEDGSGKGLNRNMQKNDLLDSGAVYVFNASLNSDFWTENTYIKANDSQEGALFGKFIAADTNSFFISAPLFDSFDSVVDAGKVYFYNLIDKAISQELLFQDVGTSSGMRFGSQLTTFGSNLVIGASGYIESESGNDEAFVGKVFTYE